MLCNVDKRPTRRLAVMQLEKVKYGQCAVLPLLFDYLMV